MDDVLDLLAVYNQFECEPAAMALEIIRLRRELLATTSRLLSHEITESLSDQTPTSVSEEPSHQVTQCLCGRKLCVVGSPDCFNFF